MADSLDPVPPHLQSFVADAILNARRPLESGQRVPSLHFIGNSGRGTVVQLRIDTSSAEGKQDAAEAARRVAAMEQADFVLSVGEDWALPVSDLLRHREIVESYGSISAYPKRVDAVSFQLETSEGFFSATPAIRPKPPSKMRRTFGTIQFIRADEAAGNLANVLPPGQAATVH